MARGGYDGQYMIAFSTLGNTIPQGNPYQQQYETIPQSHLQGNRTDSPLSPGTPGHAAAGPQYNPGPGVYNQYPAGYNTIGTHPSIQDSQPVNYLSSQNQTPGYLAQRIQPASQGQFYTLPSPNSRPLVHQDQSGVQYSPRDGKSVLTSPVQSPPESVSPRTTPSPHTQTAVTPEKITAQSLKTSTLFRTTIPLGPNNPQTPPPVTMETSPPSVKAGDTYGSEVSSVRSKENDVKPVTERPPPPKTAPPIGFTEDIDDYENVVVTNNHVVSAVVHSSENERESQPAQGTESVISSKAESESPIVSPVQGEVIYAKPKSVIDRQSRTSMIEATQTTGSTVEDDMYSVVNKPPEVVKKAPERLVGEVSEEGIYTIPPVPQKTEESYKPREDDIASVDSSHSQGSALAAMHQLAQAIRDDDEYYSSIEVEGSTMIINDSDQDDYATVGGATAGETPQSGDTQPSENPIVNGMIKKTSPRIIMHDDEDDYATVGEMPASPTDNTSPPDSNGLDESSETDITAAATSGMSIPTPGKAYVIDFDLPKGYQIGRTFQVFLHEHDIVKLKVDVIVNAANRKLKHGGGIAKTISSAAGKDMEKDCKRLLKSYKELDVSTAAVTVAGKLPCKKVIHAIGPNWMDYKDKSKVSDLLLKTFTNIFRVASTEILGTQSLALPPVSSGSSQGKFCVPNDKVAESLHQSILDLTDTEQEYRPPQQIHIVDIKPGFLQTLIEHFNGTVVTTQGTTVAVEELSNEQVLNAIGAVSLQTTDDKKSKRKLHNKPSLNLGKGRNPAKTLGFDRLRRKGDVTHL